MTRFERISRKLHRIIESAILDHGYVLRTYDQRKAIGDRYNFSDVLDLDDRSCCVKGTLKLTERGYNSVDCTYEELRAIELGFEGSSYCPTDGSYHKAKYPDFYALGQDIRERYTVRSETGK